MSAQSAVELSQPTGPGVMLAWQVAEPGEPQESLSLQEIDVPAPAAGEVLIEVWSAGLSLADVEMLRRPAAGSAVPLTPGLEVCGEVVAVGEGVARARLGERVMGVTQEPHGSLARFALARAGDVLPAPTRLDDAEASVFHLAYQVGWMGLYRRAAVRVGDALVVQGATGALGSAAVQLGRAAGAKVIAVVSSPERAATARRLGAEVTIDRTAGHVVEEVRKATDGAGADVVFDPVGGETLEQSLRMAAFEGRIVLAGAAFGSAPVPARQLLEGNVSLFGLGWRQYLDAAPEIVVRANADLNSLAEVGALRPLLAGKLDFEDAPAGLARLAAGSGSGRWAVSPPR